MYTSGGCCWQPDPWAPGLLPKLPGHAQHFASLFSRPRLCVFSRWPLGEAPDPTLLVGGTEGLISVTPIEGGAGAVLPLQPPHSHLPWAPAEPPDSIRAPSWVDAG